MEECICSYLPDNQNKKEDSQNENQPLCIAEDLLTEDVEGNTIDSKNNSDEVILQCIECTDFSNDELSTDNHNKNLEIEFITSESSMDTGNICEASKVLAIETKNWIMGKKLVKAEAEVECLQQALRSQWDIRSQLYANIQEVKTKKQNLMQEIQNNFTKHVNERNRLIQEITEIRQRLLHVNQCLSLTESKNIELEIERKDTAKCLSKSLGEHGKKSSSKNIQRHSSTTTVNSDSDTSTNSCKTTTLTKSSSSSSVYPLSPKFEPRIYTSSTQSTTTTTDIESENMESPLNCPNQEVRNIKSLKSKKPLSDHISLDLSFLDKDTPNHIDSGFSEANNLASKNSVDSCSTSRFDYAVIFN